MKQGVVMGGVKGVVFTSQFRDGQAQSEREMACLGTLDTHPQTSTGIPTLNYVATRTLSAVEEQQARIYPELSLWASLSYLSKGISLRKRQCAGLQCQPGPWNLEAQPLLSWPLAWWLWPQGVMLPDLACPSLDCGCKGSVPELAHLYSQHQGWPLYSQP